MTDNPFPLEPTAADAQATLVCVDKARNEKIAISAAIRDRLEALRSKGAEEA